MLQRPAPSTVLSSKDAALDALAASYPENRSPSLPYPSRRVIAHVTDLLLDLLMPDCRIDWGADGSDMRQTIRQVGAEVYDLLTQQADIARRHRPEGMSPEQVASFLLGQLADIRAAIHEDMLAAYRGDPAAQGPEEVILTYPTYVAVATQRVAHILCGLGVPFLPRMMTEHAHERTGIDIHPGAAIGRRFFIDHGTGVVIGETAEIGDDVTLYQGVTLGAYNFPKDDEGNLIRGTKRHPTLEDKVTIYANATVLGGATVIGEGSVIGSNVWLTKSVPPGHIVTMAEQQLRVQPKKM